jgi:uncharacterized membrane protein
VLPLHDIFAHVCGQQHNWIVGGQELPFCQRCAGLYAGAAPALLALLFFKPKPSKGMLWTHGLSLLLMAPFGYHLVAQTGELRMLTGQVFAIGLVYYLMLLPSDRWANWQKLAPRKVANYFALGGLWIVLLQFAVIWGGPRTNELLSWAGFGGLAIYGILVVLNVLLVATAASDLIHRRVHHSES